MIVFYESNQVAIAINPDNVSLVEYRSPVVFSDEIRRQASLLVYTTGNPKPFDFEGDMATGVHRALMIAMQEEADKEPEPATDEDIYFA